MEPTKGEIYIVDDKPSNIELLVSLFSKEGYRSRVVLNGEGLFSILDHVPTIPCLILLDILMPPGLDGYAVCRRLRDNVATKRIPIIFVSGLDDTSSKLLGLRTGGIFYIVKPFDPNVLVETAINVIQVFRERDYWRQVALDHGRLIDLIGDFCKNRHEVLPQLVDQCKKDQPITELGALLREQLDKREWSYGDLERASGITRSTISRLIHGKCKPSAKTLAKLAEALEIPLEELVQLATGATLSSASTLACQ